MNYWTLISLHCQGTCAKLYLFMRLLPHRLGSEQLPALIPPAELSEPVYAYNNNLQDDKAELSWLLLTPNEIFDF